MSMKP